jgi:hypothetical protein
MIKDGLQTQEPWGVPEPPLERHRPTLSTPLRQSLPRIKPAFDGTFWIALNVCEPVECRIQQVDDSACPFIRRLLRVACRIPHSRQAGHGATRLLIIGPLRSV